MRLGKGSTEISLYCLYWKRKIYIVTSATLNKSLFSEMTSPLLLNQVKILIAPKKFQKFLLAPHFFSFFVCLFLTFKNVERHCLR